MKDKKRKKEGVRESGIKQKREKTDEAEGRKENER